MDNLKIFQKFRKDCANGIVHSDRAKTSADDKDNWFVRSQTTEVKSCDFITG